MKTESRAKQRKVCRKKEGRATGEADGRAVHRRRNGPRRTKKCYKAIKKPVTLRLDADVLSWFKAQGRGYQTRINRALRAVMTKREKKVRFNGEVNRLAGYGV